MAERSEPRERPKSSATAASATAAPLSAAAVERRGDGRVRAVIDALSPMVDGGRFVAKRIAGEPCAYRGALLHRRTRSVARVLAWQGGRIRRRRTRSRCGPWETTCGLPSSRRPRRGATGAWSRPGSIPSSPGARSSSGAKSSPTFASPWLVGSALIAMTAALLDDADAEALKDWAALLLESVGPKSAADAPSLKALALDPERARLMQRHADRSLADSAALEIFADRKRAGFSRLVRALSKVRSVAAGAAWQLQRRRGAPAVHRRDGLRRRLFPAHPTDRPRQPQGSEQLARREERRRRQPLGDRLRRGRPQANPAGARNARGFPAPRGPGA